MNQACAPVGLRDQWTASALEGTPMVGLLGVAGAAFAAKVVPRQKGNA
jgi:hypothetical protein